jgi:predicted TPR repeat methyltransferase
MVEIERLNLREPRVLELGCGTGLFAERVIDRSGDYLGLDISPAAIAIARERVPRGEFRAADIIVEDLQQCAYDIVVAIDTLAYVREQPTVASKIYGALSPGGVAIFTSVNPFVFKRLSWVTAPGEGQYRHWLSRRDYRELLSSAGMCVRTAETFFPLGDRGVLRWINSRRLNWLPNALLGGETVRRFKEYCGLGSNLIIVAQKPSGP